MASELRKYVTCDVCGSEDATEYGAVRAASEPRDVDLCRAHAEPVLALEALLEAHGRRPGRAPALPTRGRPRRPSSAGGTPPAGGWASSRRDLLALFRTCPVCGEERLTRGSLSQHVKSKHPGSGALAALERNLGVEFRCPQCGQVGPSYGSVAHHASNAGHSLYEPSGQTVIPGIKR